MNHLKTRLGYAPAITVETRNAVYVFAQDAWDEMLDGSITGTLPAMANGTVARTVVIPWHTIRFISSKGEA